MLQEGVHPPTLEADSRALGIVLVVWSERRGLRDRLGLALQVGHEEAGFGHLGLETHCVHPPRIRKGRFAAGWCHPMKASKLVRSVVGRAVPGGRIVRSAALPAAAHVLPSVLVLGQWWPDLGPPLRALPGGLCRWRGPDTGRPEVALTFDDGPDPQATLAAASLLEEAEMRGTFFTVGEQVEAHPDVVRQLRARGHEVGTHGYRHRHHLLQRAADTSADLRRAVGALEKLGAGFRPRYFRPPYGQVSTGSIVACQRAGLEMVLWSAWGREWAEEEAEPVIERITRRLGPGAIVLLHDSDATSPPGTAARARKALEGVLEHLLRDGLVSVTLPELLRR